MATPVRRRAQREGPQMDGVSPDPVADRFLAAGEGGAAARGGIGERKRAQSSCCSTSCRPPGRMSCADVSGAALIPLLRKNRAAAQAHLRRLEKQVKGPHLRTHTLLTEGVPFHQIIRAAKRLRCDLIVMATHGRTGLVHAIMGSVAENVLRRAPCPVLVVRPARFQSGA